MFLQTAAQILCHAPTAYFAIAGDGELRDALRQQAVSLGISSRVIWTGWLSNLAPFYAAIDVLLFNSDWDAFPTTPIEAMSSRVPVVASLQRGGLSEILDNRCGWLLERHDPGALAAAVAAALSPEGQVKADSARKRVAALCDPSKIAEKKIELRLLEGRDARAC